MALPLGLAAGCLGRGAADADDTGAETLGDSSTGNGADDETSDGDSSDDGTRPLPCEGVPSGEFVCVADEKYVCDGRGGVTEVYGCQLTCLPDLGCVECIPGDRRCNEEGNAEVCRYGGQGWDVWTCDAVQGVVCDERSGSCVGACSSQSLPMDGRGCDFFAAPLPVRDNIGEPVAGTFAVSVASDYDVPVDVTVTRGDLEVTTATIAPQSVTMIPLPWSDPFDGGPLASVKLAGAAFRIRTTAPVSVVQFDGTTDNSLSEATVLLSRDHEDELPISNTSTTSWKPQNGGVSTVTVIAQGTGTTTLKLPENGAEIVAGGGFEASGSGSAMLKAGDVLHVIGAPGADLHGTAVLNGLNRVIGGNTCAKVGNGDGPCGHLADIAMNVGGAYWKYAFVPPMGLGGASERTNVVRITVFSKLSPTSLNYTPDQPGAPTSVSESGAVVDLPPTNQAFVLEASAPVVAAQFAVESATQDGTSGPSMLTAQGINRWRSEYRFYSSAAWDEAYLTIIRASEAEVYFDSALVTNWIPIAGTTYAYARVNVADSGDVHSVISDAMVGAYMQASKGTSLSWYSIGVRGVRISGE